jgi:hypothetical protein
MIIQTQNGHTLAKAEIFNSMVSSLMSLHFWRRRIEICVSLSFAFGCCFRFSVYSMQVKVGLCSVKSKLLHQGMCGSTMMTLVETPPSWTRLFQRFGHLTRAGRRFKLVGEGSELPHMGCVETWQRRCTTIFLLLCRCLVLGVVMFSLAMCSPSCTVWVACPFVVTCSSMH